MSCGIKVPVYYAVFFLVLQKMYSIRQKST